MSDELARFQPYAAQAQPHPATPSGLVFYSDFIIIYSFVQSNVSWSLAADRRYRMQDDSGFCRN